MNDFIAGIVVGVIIVSIIYMFKLKGIYEKYTDELIQLRSERNKYYALYRLNADPENLNNERRD